MKTENIIMETHSAGTAHQARAKLQMHVYVCVFTIQQGTMVNLSEKFSIASSTFFPLSPTLISEAKYIKNSSSSANSSSHCSQPKKKTHSIGKKRKRQRRERESWGF